MNESKIMIILNRMFSKKYYKPLAGVRSKVQLIKQNRQDVENFDSEDISEFETDFMNVSESHKMHEREMQRNKEYLKQQIVNQKYFKEKMPRFLTFVERQLICKLYESNCEEWTVEKLSESFPVLPKTIQKILHDANWLPKSMKRVMQYDEIVIENWKKFHAGKLPISPRLNEHLMKFKNRKIILTDRESVTEQFVSLTPKFTKPKSQLFSNIVQSYLDEKQNDKKLSQEDKIKNVFTHSNKNQTLSIIDNKTESNSIVIKNSEKFTLNEQGQYLTLNMHIVSKKHDILPFKKNNDKKLFTFDEFVTAKLEDIQRKSPKEVMTLLNLYRKQIDVSKEIQTASEDARISIKKDTLEIVPKSNENISTVSENKDVDFNFVIEDNNWIDTSIKMWNKKIDTEHDYVKPIKILKNLYKPGMTYRISDCYYDDDGEFLYRVLGI